MRLSGIIALAFVALAMAACGGGGGGSSPSSSLVVPTTAPTNAGNPTPAATNLPAGYARANVSITIPASSSSTSSNQRSAKNVGTGTSSITFSLLQQTAGLASPAPQTFGLTASSPGCTTNANTGNLVCTIGVAAPIGSDIFLANTYTGTNGDGNLTGSGAVALSVQLNSVNTANLSLSGQVATVFLASSASYLGTPTSSVSRHIAVAGGGATTSSVQLFVIALDNQGNIILNPSVFTSPVYVQLYYPSGAADVTLKLVPGSEGGPTQGPVSANYASVQVFSPTDQITATIIPNVSYGANPADLLGNIGSPFLANGATLSNTPTAFAQIAVNQVPAPSGVILLYDPATNSYITSKNFLGLGSDTLYIEEANFSGNFTISSPACAGIVNFSLTNFSSYAQLNATAAAVGTCSATISDGTVNLTVPITVTTTLVTGS